VQRLLNQVPINNIIIKFYRLLNVEINASLPQIEAAYKKLSLLYHPDRHDNDKDAWTAQFQILSTIKSTLTNTEERQKYNLNPGRPLRMPNASVDVPQRLHRVGSGTTCGNAKQRLHLRQRGRAELARHSGARWTPKTLLQTPVQASAASKRRQIAQLHAHAFALAHAQNHVKRDSARQRSEEVGTQGGVYGFRAIFCFCKNK
jgi:hypothetical protein